MKPSSDDVTWPLDPSWPLGLAGPTPELFSHVSHCIPTTTTVPFFLGGGLCLEAHRTPVPRPESNLHHLQWKLSLNHWTTREVPIFPLFEKPVFLDICHLHIYILVNIPPRSKHTSSVFRRITSIDFVSWNLMVNPAWLDLCHRCFLFWGVTDVFHESSVLNVSQAQCLVHWSVVCRIYLLPLLSKMAVSRAALQPSGKFRRSFLRFGETDESLEDKWYFPQMESDPEWTLIFQFSWIVGITRVRTRLQESTSGAGFTSWTKVGLPPVTGTILLHSIQSSWWSRSLRDAPICSAHIREWTPSYTSLNSHEA